MSLLLPALRQSRVLRLSALAQGPAASSGKDSAAVHVIVMIVGPLWATRRPRRLAQRSRRGPETHRHRRWKCCRLGCPSRREESHQARQPTRAMTAAATVPGPSSQPLVSESSLSAGAG